MEKVKNEIKVILDDKFYLDVDDYTFNLVELKDNVQEDGTIKTTVYEHGYFSSIGSALSKYIKVSTNRKYAGREISLAEYNAATLDVYVGLEAEIEVTAKEIAKRVKKASK